MVMIARWNQTSTEKLFKVFNSGGWVKKKKRSNDSRSNFWLFLSQMPWMNLQYKLNEKKKSILTLGHSPLKYFRWHKESKSPKPIFISRVSAGTLFEPRKEEEIDD